MTPTVGRIVNYHLPDGEYAQDLSGREDEAQRVVAAIITAVHSNGRVTLAYFMPRFTSLQWRENLSDKPEDNGPPGGHWSWPERVAS